MVLGALHSVLLKHDIMLSKQSRSSARKQRGESLHQIHSGTSISLVNINTSACLVSSEGLRKQKPQSYKSPNSDGYALVITGEDIKR